MVEAKEISFNTEMVKAIMDGRKTQTRRPIKPQPAYVRTIDHTPFADTKYDGRQAIASPYGDVGDRLWVRESARVAGWLPNSRELELTYAADHKTWCGTLPRRLEWVPKFGHCVPNGIFKEAARIFLEIKKIRVESLQDMTESDAYSEGVKPVREPVTEPANEYRGSYRHMAHGREFRYNFAKLWDSIYKPRGLGWDANPWVWVYDFERVEK